MITFENITQTKSVYTQFLPILLIPLITPYLKKADIPFKTLGLEDLTVDHQLTGEIQPVYKKNVEDAREKYRNAGYQNVRCIGAIITHISPDDFNTMTLQFFGDTMDLDFASEQRLAKEKSDALYESSYKDWLPEGTLPVCDNKNK